MTVGVSTEPRGPAEAPYDPEYVLLLLDGGFGHIPAEEVIDRRDYTATHTMCGRLVEADTTTKFCAIDVATGKATHPLCALCVVRTLHWWERARRRRRPA